MQQPFALDTNYLWLAGAVVLLALLVGAFVYVVVHRNRHWLQERLTWLDVHLAQWTPGPWHFVKRRFSRETWYGLTFTASLLLFGITTYLFAQITDSWLDQKVLYQIDQAVNQMVQGRLGQTMVGGFRFITHFGSLYVATSVSIVLALYYVARKHWWQLLALFLAVGVGEGVLWGLKLIFARTRPGTQLTSAVGYSFPSGHSFTAMVLYGFLIYLTWHRTDRTAIRVAVTAGLGLLILAVGTSRIVLSVHWVSDVIGGFTIGLAWLVCSLVLTRLLHDYRAETAS